jgi:hypothetical protein
LEEKMSNLVAMMLFQDDSGQGSSAFGAGAGAAVTVVSLAVMVIVIAAMWKVFQKAGQPGWAAIIPIYNIIVLLKIAGKPIWWIILFLIPLVNIVIAFIVALGVAQKFGKGTGFALGLFFLSPIFYPILAWGDAQYQG